MLVPEGSALQVHPPLLAPFDALLCPYVTHASRLYLARRASAHIQQHITPAPGSLSPTPAPGFRTADGVLRIGFISYDINNHPTAHLLEAVFLEVRAALGGSGGGSGGGGVFGQVQLYVYAYGRDDNSTYRRRLVEVCMLAWLWVCCITVCPIFCSVSGDC